jgi:hypothetical protein
VPSVVELTVAVEPLPRHNDVAVVVKLLTTGIGLTTTVVVPGVGQELTPFTDTVRV